MSLGSQAEFSRQSRRIRSRKSASRRWASAPGCRLHGIEQMPVRHVASTTMAEIHAEPTLRGLSPGYEDPEQNLRPPLTAVGTAAVPRTGVEIYPLRQKTSAGHKIARWVRRRYRNDLRVDRDGPDQRKDEGEDADWQRGESPLRR